MLQEGTRDASVLQGTHEPGERQLGVRRWLLQKSEALGWPPSRSSLDKKPTQPTDGL